MKRVTALVLAVLIGLAGWVAWRGAWGSPPAPGGPLQGETKDTPPPGPLAPDIVSTTWLNSEPLTPADLRGRVVLIEFWTYG